MVATVVGVKLDEDVRERLRAEAERLGRSPHWLAKQAIIHGIERLERGESPLEGQDQAGTVMPFVEFAQSVQPQSVLRAAITGAYRRPEPECLPGLIEAASLPAPVEQKVHQLASGLVTTLRAKRTRGLVETLLHEYSLSSQEGVALMCLAEALLRIPDAPTRDALIRDKVAGGDWRRHWGESPSLFVNAATWGLLLTGRLTATASEAGLSSALTKLVARGGEPVIRKGVDLVMRLMGEQFVMGRDIAEALANARRWEKQGFRYSYDMLGEAALTEADAARYYRDYEQAIHAIGKAAGGKGIYEGPGISVKLSALHPRYSRMQRGRVMAELLLRLIALAKLARRYDIGLNIDAEEAERLELSLDLLEDLCFDPAFEGWNGIGFVVQAYQKRAPFVLDFLIDLAHRSRRRLMVRLVKGAYWDSEIKRAQVDGLEGFPVFTRKVHTDVSYLACARKLLAAPDAVFPQFATHNAHTLAAIMAMGGENFYAGQYEFQCLHGMGEPLYEEVVGPRKLNRPCRIYAPVGTHETLLAYLVRRLLENGANTSFVNRIADARLSVDELVADPVAEARRITPLGAPHPKIALPRALFGAARQNSAGIDLSNEQRLASLASGLLASAGIAWHAGEGEGREIRNPADRRDLVGFCADADAAAVDAALARAERAAPVWQATPPADRARALRRAADALEARMPVLIGLLVREAGKTMSAAVNEVREATDFLRYYAGESGAFNNDTHRPLGLIATISPWNFPLAIFIGQTAAALAAANVVLAKPAEETPLIAAEAVRLLHESGVPADAVQLLPGDGAVGARLVADGRIRGVVFTGSTEVARLIQVTLAKRLDPAGRPIPLIAETGGQNAMVVDSSALPEQAVADIIASAFDSAGQRCSALRILLVQEEVAPRLLEMLKGAMRELALGNPGRLATDIGPVISKEARDGIAAHVAAMAKDCPVFQAELPESCRFGTFIAPTLIEIDSVARLGREVFGPVLHVLRYKRGALDQVIKEVNALGYALTFGIHSRIDETIAHVSDRIEAGNLYVNRNIIGAVVGVQPFGGHGLSGTGPKAGGPLYLRRLLATCPDAGFDTAPPSPALRDFLTWTEARGARIALPASLQANLDLPGPVGEQTLYRLEPRRAVLCHAGSEAALFAQIAACLAAGAAAVIDGEADLAGLPPSLAPLVRRDRADIPVSAALFSGASDALLAFQAGLAQRSGPLVTVYRAADERYPPESLLQERVVSVNTAAAGGNASLMVIG
jgi:RHH-type proline utilization regulon transcriptional repressor/proline dehydrogenase/delta 1-pyrroline-5-carboxylate dehydrogenase